MGEIPSCPHIRCQSGPKQGSKTLWPGTLKCQREHGHSPVHPQLGVRPAPSTSGRGLKNTPDTCRISNGGDPQLL